MCFVTIYVNYMNICIFIYLALCLVHHLNNSDSLYIHNNYFIETYYDVFYLLTYSDIVENRTCYLKI